MAGYHLPARLLTPELLTPGKKRDGQYKIKKNHPLAAGLKFATVISGGGFGVDLVSGVHGERSNTAIHKQIGLKGPELDGFNGSGRRVTFNIPPIEFKKGIAWVCLLNANSDSQWDPLFTIRQSSPSNENIYYVRQGDNAFLSYLGGTNAVSAGSILDEGNYHFYSYSAANGGAPNWYRDLTQFANSSGTQSDLSGLAIDEVNLGGNLQFTSETLDGQIGLLYLFDLGKQSDAWHRSFALDSLQILEPVLPDIYINIGAVSGVPQLIINSLLHAHSLDAGSITEHNQVAPNALDHAHSLDAGLLTQHHIIPPIDVDQAHSLDAGSISTIGVLNPAAIDQSQTIDIATLTQHHVTAINDIAQSVTLDPSALVQHYSLTLDAIDQAHSLDVGEVLVGVLNPADLDHSQTIDIAVITQHHQLTANPIDQAHSLDAAVLGVLPSGTITAQISILRAFNTAATINRIIESEGDL